MGRKPQGDAALTGAERQARYQLRHGAIAPQAVPPPRLPSRRPSLRRRWADAVAGLVSVQAEYARWLEALPEATGDNPT